MKATLLLIRKEWLYLSRNLKSLWITTCVLLLIFVMIYPTGILTAGIIGPYMLVYGVMAYEEQSHSEMLNGMLPVSYREICRSKYVLGLVYMILITIAGTSILILGRSLGANRYDIFEVLDWGSVLMILGGGALLYTAFIIPMIYKFGCIKMKIVMALIYGGVFGLSISVANVLEEVQVDFNYVWNESFLETSLLIIGLVAYGVSYLISLRILRNKEYTV